MKIYTPFQDSRPWPCFAEFLAIDSGIARNSHCQATGSDRLDLFHAIADHGNFDVEHMVLLSEAFPIIAEINSRQRHDLFSLTPTPTATLGPTYRPIQWHHELFSLYEPSCTGS